MIYFWKSDPDLFSPTTQIFIEYAFIKEQISSVKASEWKIVSFQKETNTYLSLMHSFR